MYMFVFERSCIVEGRAGFGLPLWSKAIHLEIGSANRFVLSKEAKKSADRRQSSFPWYGPTNVILSLISSALQSAWCYIRRRQVFDLKGRRREDRIDLNITFLNLEAGCLSPFNRP
jgi:hypothetical protein